MLENIDLSLTVSGDEYKNRLPVLQSKLHRLQRAFWQSEIPVILVFEGWDAAGKGTAISKLVQLLEPRGFNLHAIRAPRTYETLMPWLWRYWTKIPRYGQMAIFDRSWYGKVLVQRVDGLIGDNLADYIRDINHFEQALVNDGYVIVKFFLHITKEEQRRRFELLEADPLTAWQVEEEDWKHHRQYDQYLVVTEEALALTESEWAPWTIVEATDKRWTRIKIFETVISRLERELRERGFPLPEYFDFSRSHAKAKQRDEDQQS